MKLGLAALALFLALLLGCMGAPASTATPPFPPTAVTSTPTRVATAPPAPTPIAGVSAGRIKYRLIDHFGGVFYCDPDYYPVGSPEREQERALKIFPQIQGDAGEFQAILDRLGLPEQPSYTDEQKLLIYREHKLLNAVQLEATENGYRFTLRMGENQGEAISGRVTGGDSITIEQRQPEFHTCPICLALDTLIDTPFGPVAVQDLRPGQTIWTQDKTGRRVAAVVAAAVSVLAPTGHQMARLTLADGRSLTASPGHPLADGKPIGLLAPGDAFDGSKVVSAIREPYIGSTYDILPAGDTAVYWANGVPLRSSLAQPR